MRTVFLVQHVHNIDNNEEVKTIGIYSDEKQAELAIKRLHQQPGFREVPQGFTVDRYVLDQDYWAEGFETVKM